MKTKALFLTLSIAVIGLTSCSDGSGEPSLDKTESYIDATSKTTWHYFSLSENKVIGTGEQNDTDNGKWALRTDWDIAVSRYLIRTNSGAATAVKANGGVYTFGSTTSFDSVTALPQGVAFVADKAVVSEGMGGVTTTTVQSGAAVILFKKNDDGTTIMPPVYLQAPVYIFRTSNGLDHYKVQFTQYQNENKVSGYVKFYSAQIK